MIDATSSRAYDEIEARAGDLANQFRSGYVPSHDDSRGTAVRATMSLDPLHAVAPEQTYFVGTDQQGRRFYSRDSALHVDGGELRTRDGSAILGYANPGGSLAPLRVDPVDAALGRVSNLHVTAEGELAYTRTLVDPKTGAKKEERVVAGALALARFPSGTRVDAADGVHVTAPAGVEPQLGRPGAGGFGKLVPHADDLGAVDIHRGLTRLRDAYLAFSAFQSAKGARGHTDKIAMDLIK